MTSEGRSVSPTREALEQEKLSQEIERLDEQNAWWVPANVATVFSAVGALLLAAAAVFRYFSDRSDARQQQEIESKRQLQNQREERFRAVVEGLGSGKVEAQIAAAVTLRSFLRNDDEVDSSPDIELLYQQVFDLAAAYLRLPTLAATATKSHIFHDFVAALRKQPRFPRDDVDETRHALASVLATDLVESYPLARGKVPADAEKPLDWESAKLVWREYAYLDARKVAIPRVSMIGADLRYATMGEANFNTADLSRSDLSGAQLVGADFRNANLRDAKVRGAQCITATFTATDFRGADLHGADLTGAKVVGSNIELACDLTDTIMCDISDLSNAQRKECKRKGAIFDNGSSHRSL